MYISQSPAMEKDSSFIFSGTKFDRRKFAQDFIRFKDTKGSDSSIGQSNLLMSNEPEAKETENPVNKKRKRKSTLSEPEGSFSIFKCSKSKIVADESDQAENEIVQRKKEHYRQLEKDAILRKKYNIHISGRNVPSPLQNFLELSTRFAFRYEDLVRFNDEYKREPIFLFVKIKLARNFVE